LTAYASTLAACEDDVIDRDRYDEIEAFKGCATIYCGRGRCVGTEAGAGCDCDAGYVARSFTDYDGEESITCVPDAPPVDLAAGGIDIPNICDTLTLESSETCLDLSGFAGMQCGNDEAAVLNGSGVAPGCSPITVDSETSGARDYTREYTDLAICAPAPPACDAMYGWLEETGFNQRDSVEACDSSLADPSWLEEPEKPTCDPDNPLIDLTMGTTNLGSSQPTRLMQDDTTTPRMTDDMPLGKGGDGGCAMSSTRAANGSASLIALAMLLLWRRRRTR
jgi:MYXO-CTERM domain-containing protein